MAIDRGALLGNGAPMKAISLVTLTFQNSALILIMHYSRVMPLVNGQRYHTSTSVLLNEIIKLGISATAALYDITTKQGPNTPATTLFKTFISQVFTNESWKLAIPAALYTLQNSLQYVAVSNLDPSTFQVTYQLKILTTAIFSVIMLGRVLSPKKWASLLLLIIGVAAVQIPQSKPEPVMESVTTPEGQKVRRSLELAGGVAHRALSSFVARSAPYNVAREEEAAHMDKSVGLIAVLVACGLSGLAGVTFEKILKMSTPTPAAEAPSLWIRNVQLSFWSLFPALFLGCIWVDGANIAADGFFAGYNWVVWTAIMFQAGGGILVSLVIKYADNIAKNFATSISIIVSALASAYFFDFQITMTYLIGTSIVMAATYLYSQPDRAPPQSTKTMDLENPSADHESAHPLLTVTPSRSDDGGPRSPGSPTPERDQFPKRDA